MGVQIGAAGISPPERRPTADGEPAGGSWVSDAADAPDALAASGARASISVPTPAHANAVPIEQAVPGRGVENDFGSCYISVVSRAVDEEHAGERVGEALEACTNSMAEMAGDPALADLDWARTAFVDTETTGLSGAAGTYAFLIGAGRFENGAFHVRQFFMRHPGEEAAQLAELEEWVAGCTGLVTFNGKSFDAPLLATRYMMNGRPDPLAGARHLDLLPASRRMWRRRLPNCRLVSLEEHVLGLQRVDDVPGWMVPERYLRYQREGDARPLEGIFRHNALDILSMVSLVTRLARSWERPEEALAHARDWLSLAKAYERAKRLDRAMVACQAALATGLARPAEVDEAFERLSLAARRQGDWERAVAIWQDQVASERPRRLFPFEELAKYHEHRATERDLPAALAVTERGYVLVEERVIRPRRGRRQALEDLSRRRDRLRQRIERAAGGGSRG
jgi:uncharacterized protein YprB with RNaseH-like and TPR domain